MPKNSKKRSVSGRVQQKWRALFGLKTPHKSFRYTPRDAAVRPLVMPSYLAFSNSVTALILSHKRVFLSLGALYAALYAVLVGVGSQETYTLLGSLFEESTGGTFQDVVGTVWGVGALIATVSFSGLTEEQTALQSVFSLFLFAMMWLSVVWLARNVLAGKKVKMRDGLYSSGAPLFATLAVFGLLILQLIPVGVAALGYGAASATGLLSGGVEAMLFWFAAALLATLSIYWVISSLFAIVLVTIPGTYPLWALHASSKLVSGRRVKIFSRLLWMLSVVAVTWVLVLLVAVLFDALIRQVLPGVNWLPIVPFAVLLLTAWSALWGSVYIYLLYRKLVDNETK